jgi:hypothetical protein
MMSSAVIIRQVSLLSKRGTESQQEMASQESAIEEILSGGFFFSLSYFFLSFFFLLFAFCSVFILALS